MCTPVILCRSGYTSLMDLATLGLKAIVVPTPGQYEQMYLAQYHHMQKNVWAVNQNHLDIENAFIQYHKIKGFSKAPEPCFQKAIDVLF